MVFVKYFKVSYIKCGEYVLLIIKLQYKVFTDGYKKIVTVPVKAISLKAQIT